MLHFLRSFACLLVPTLLLANLLSPSSKGAVWAQTRDRAVETRTANLSPTAQALLAAINQERLAAGLPTFTFNPALQVAAQRHADDMATANFFSHRGSDDRDVAARVAATGYPAQQIAQNLAAGETEAAGILQIWLESTEYRQNLLNADYTEVGIGYAANPEADFEDYWVLVLGQATMLLRKANANAPGATPPPNDTIATLLTLTNELRAEACVPLLRLHPSLLAIAQAEASELDTPQSLTRSIPTAILERQLRNNGYNANQALALLSSQLSNPAAALAEWQRQNRSAAALLIPEYQDVGFGFAPTRDRAHWSIVLAEPQYPASELPPRPPILTEVGALEPGRDEVLPSDGSSYDLYSFVGQAGQEVIITLESEVFDPYLFLFNADNLQIADNDDRAESDTNSQIRVTLPCDGPYKVMVNSYNPQSEGEYTLTIY